MAVDHKVLKDGFYQQGKDGRLKTITVSLTPGLAIKLKCTECTESAKDIKECLATTCPLYPYRGYSRANQEKSELSEKQKTNIERLKHIRKKR